MNRILSIEQSQQCSGQSVYVTKRLCISVVLSIGFLCILGGYLLGQLSAARRDSERVLFKEVPSKVTALLKKVEGLSNSSIQNSTYAFEQRIKEVFECVPLNNFIVDSDKVTEFLKSIIANKEEELVKSIDIAVKYIDSIR